jgi:hypothetical protein
MKTVTTVTERKATIRPMFVSRVVKPPLAVGHRQWLSGDWLRHRATREPSLKSRPFGRVSAIAGGARGIR